MIGLISAFIANIFASFLGTFIFREKYPKILFTAYFSF